MKGLVSRAGDYRRQRGRAETGGEYRRRARFQLFRIALLSCVSRNDKILAKNLNTSIFSKSKGIGCQARQMKKTFHLLGRKQKNK